MVSLPTSAKVTQGFLKCIGNSNNRRLIIGPERHLEMAQPNHKPCCFSDHVGEAWSPFAGSRNCVHGLGKPVFQEKACELILCLWLTRKIAKVHADGCAARICMLMLRRMLILAGTESHACLTPWLKGLVSELMLLYILSRGCLSNRWCLRGPGSLSLQCMFHLMAPEEFSFLKSNESNDPSTGLWSHSCSTREPHTQRASASASMLE